MSFFLDTHILVWLHADRKKLSQEAIEILKNSDNDFYYSPINIWEAQVKHSAYPETFTISGEDLYFLCNRANINYLAIKPEHAIALKTLAYSSSAPRPHKDPFDRMLICQAKTEGMLFLTHDSLIPYYNEPCTVSV
jgi:PIN domain nuclease of toxin-antitoxin system